MAKFIFPMENLLNLKRKLEDQAKAEYGAQLAILHEEEQKLLVLQQRKEELQEQLKQQMESVLDLIHIRQLEDGVESLKYSINVQKFRILAQQKVVEQAREKLDAAMIERKTYEKLKEKAFEEFKKELAAQEQKEVDELVSFRFGNKEERED